jgi:hypothetical protein
MQRTLVICSLGIPIALMCSACSNEADRAKAEAQKAQAEAVKAQAEAAKAEADVARARAEDEKSKQREQHEAMQRAQPLKVTGKFDADRPVIGDDTGWVICRIVNDNAESHAVHVVGSYVSDNNPTLSGSTDVTVPGGSVREARINFGKIDLGRSKNPRATCNVTASDGTPIKYL